MHRQCFKSVWLCTRQQEDSSEQTSKSLIKANYVSGRMNSSEREERIRSLKNIKEGEIGILSNARCLSEGVDGPTLDGIAFIDPRRSQVDIILAVGRAIRRTRTGKVKWVHNNPCLPGRHKQY